MSPEYVIRKFAQDNNVILREGEAARVAGAVLACYDYTLTVSMMIDPENWPEAAEFVRTRQRRDLWLEMADKRVLPVAAPLETVNYGQGAWEDTIVTLSVPVRRMPEVE